MRKKNNLSKLPDIETLGLYVVMFLIIASIQFMIFHLIIESIISDFLIVLVYVLVMFSEKKR